MKELMYKRIANLLAIKSLVTIVVMIVFAYMALTGAIASDVVMNVVVMVVGFYFGTQQSKPNGDT